jgi:hypothetical protein
VTTNEKSASQATAELPKLPEPDGYAAISTDGTHSIVVPPQDFAKHNAYAIFTADQMNAHYLAGFEAGRASRAQSEWLPIETAPKEGRTMFVVRGFDVTNPNCGAHHYTTDPYCVWPGYGGGWVRWPHVFPPTHWMPLPATLGETK